VANVLAQNPTAQSYSNASSVALSFAGAGTNPSLYVASLTQENTTNTVTIADDKNAGNYAADAAGVGGSTGNAGSGQARIRSKQNTSTGTATVTATISAADYGVLKTFEITGAATSSALDAQNGTGGSLSARSIGITTGSANCTVIATGTNYPNDDAADANYTDSFAVTGLNSSYHYGEYRVDAGAAGVITLTFSAPGNSDNWAMAVAAYKTAGGAAAPVGSYYYRQVAGRS
jgi:hypothetical protein